MAPIKKPLPNYAQAKTDTLSAEATTGNDLITPANWSTMKSNDLISGLAGDDTLKGYSGNDTLEGGAGNDALGGGTGNDKIYGYTEADPDNAEDGNDDIGAWGGNDEIYAGYGDDIGNGGAGNDKIYCGAGNDSFGGDLNPSKLASYEIDATSTEYTKYGNDTIYGGTGNDTLNGCGGNDKVYGEDGDDFLYGDREGVDGVLDTTNGYDAVKYSGNDSLDGGAGNDSIHGRSGNDKLEGGEGNDLLNGGKGSDMLTGGSGTDYFVFTTPLASNGRDKITDFTSGEDKLWLDTDIFTTFASMTVTADNFTTESKAGADDYLVYTKGALYYDADANGSTKAVLIAQVSNLQFDDLMFGTDYTTIVL